MLTELTLTPVLKLGFLAIRSHPDMVNGNNCKQTLSRLILWPSSAVLRPTAMFLILHYSDDKRDRSGANKMAQEVLLGAVVRASLPLRN